MFVPDGKPDEVTTAGTEAARWPFLEVREAPRLAASASHRSSASPATRASSSTISATRPAAFLEASPDRRAQIYRTAVTDLAAAQTALADLPEAPSSTPAPSTRPSSAGVSIASASGASTPRQVLSPADLAAWDAVADRLAKRIASWPRGFVHRDYQSRNLMVQRTPEGRAQLVWIDFQDALLGPASTTSSPSSTTATRRSIAPSGGPHRRIRNRSRPRSPGPRRARPPVRSPHRAAQAQGRRPLHLHRSREEEPLVPPLFRPIARRVRASLARLQQDEDMRWIAQMLSRTFG
ncbi:MAG: phosphotransferase [Polyangiaceae bacterium]